MSSLLPCVHCAVYAQSWCCSVISQRLLLARPAIGRIWKVIKCGRRLDLHFDGTGAGAVTRSRRHPGCPARRWCCGRRVWSRGLVSGRRSAPWSDAGCWLRRLALCQSNVGRARFGGIWVCPSTGMVTTVGYYPDHRRVWTACRAAVTLADQTPENGQHPAIAACNAGDSRRVGLRIPTPCNCVTRFMTRNADGDAAAGG